MPGMAQAREERVSAIRGFPSKTSHRLSALSGLAACVLIIVSFLLDLSRPHFDDAPAKYVSYYVNNQSQLQIALLCLMFSSFGFVWYFGFLRWLYEGAERATRGFVRAAPMAFGGGLAGTAFVAATGVAQLTAVETAGSIKPGMTRALDLFSIYGTVWGEVLLCVFLLSSFFIVRVTQVLPAWLGGLALLATVIGFIQAALVLSPGSDDSVFGIANIIFFLLFLIFIAGSSLSLSRRGETALLGG
jgi:hypothetical protein